MSYLCAGDNKHQSASRAIGRGIIYCCLFRITNKYREPVEQRGPRIQYFVDQVDGNWTGTQYTTKQKHDNRRTREHREYLKYYWLPCFKEMLISKIRRTLKTNCFSVRKTDEVTLKKSSTKFELSKLCNFPPNK